MEKSKLYHLELHKDKVGYYLSATYTKEDDHRISEVYLPKIRMALHQAPAVIVCTEEKPYSMGHITRQYVDIGFGKVLLEEGKDGYAYIERVIEEKTTEMTLAEVEKKLGYKVKIVSEK